MPLTWQVNSLQMEWCLNCHRDPSQYIRPRSQVYNLDYNAATDMSLKPELRSQEALGAQLVKDYHIHTEQLTNCSICHR
jgi:hypothetical protein